MQTSSTQAGFAVTELMVALTLSTFVILSIVSLFLSNSQTMRVQSAVSEVSDSGRYAIDRMARDLRMIGFRSGGYANPIPLADSMDTGAGVSDTLTIRFEAPVDCNRMAADAAGVVENFYEVVDANLECNGEVLARGVEQLRVWLGEDLDGNKIPERFVLSGSASLIMDRVVSVKLDVLVRSGGKNVTTSLPAFQGLWKGAIANDSRLRHEFSVTVALRNRL